ncbi:uncharacterized protein LOC133485332 isoform X2 [Phyllopteryx taeniolatus]|nr:uncharacterized protein LOC133485332 isoform X2 [Phyllopteryx taeniolatus]
MLTLQDDDDAKANIAAGVFEKRARAQRWTRRRADDKRSTVSFRLRIWMSLFCVCVCSLGCPTLRAGGAEEPLAARPKPPKAPESLGLSRCAGCFKRQTHAVRSAGSSEDRRQSSSSSEDDDDDDDDDAPAGGAGEHEGIRAHRQNETGDATNGRQGDRRPAPCVSKLRSRCDRHAWGEKKKAQQEFQIIAFDFPHIVLVIIVVVFFLHLPFLRLQFLHF